MRFASTLPSFESCLAAVSVNSIRQAKLGLDLIDRTHRLFTLADPLADFGGQIIIFHLFKAAFDDLAQIIGLAASCPRRKSVETPVGFRR